jgi:phosphatidylethanolamine-binding protein (PEBP) family uncharacterized protein
MNRAPYRVGPYCVAPAIAPGFSFGPNIGPKPPNTRRYKTTLYALTVRKKA